MTTENLDMDYSQYDFKDSTEMYVHLSKKGLTKETVIEISKMKNEPQWMLDFRLRSYEIFMKKPMPTWGGDLSVIDFQNIYYYAKASDKVEKNWDDVPENVKNTFDKLGIPRIHMNFKLQNSVRKTMSTFLEEVGRFFINNDLGRIKIEEWLYDYDKDFSKYGQADNGCHHIGSTRMGIDAKESVVDKNLKVHNTDNLYVAGSSVFTSGGAANPTLTICQLSLKLANHLSKIL